MGFIEELAKTSPWESKALSIVGQIYGISTLNEFLSLTDAQWLQVHSFHDYKALKQTVERLSKQP